MSFAVGFLRGFMSVLAIKVPPLYRYPYRTAAEAFRGDWKRVGHDVELALERDSDMVPRENNYGLAYGEWDEQSRA